MILQQIKIKKKKKNAHKPNKIVEILYFCFYISKPILVLLLFLYYKNFSRGHFKNSFLIFPENKFSHFMQTGDNLHEISKHFL